MVLLLKENIERVYRASICSSGFCLCLLFSLIIIIIPVFLSASTNGFWPSTAIYIEQPIVLFRNELIITVYSETRSVSGSSIIKTPSSYFYSTIGDLSQLTSATNSPMELQFEYLDFNADYKPDMHDFNITLNLDPSSVRNIKIIANFDYRLRDRVNLDMIAMSYVDIDTPRGCSGLYLDGSLELKQRTPLRPSKIIRSTYNTTLLDYTSPVDNFFPRLFYRYFSRNETTYYNYQKTVVPQSQTDSLSINMKIRVPNQHVLYTPIFIQNLKFAWIQYLSLLIPIYFLIGLFAKFVFTQQIFETASEIKY